MIILIITGVILIGMGSLICYVHHVEITDSESYAAYIVDFYEKFRKSGRFIYKVYCPIAVYEKNGRKITAQHHSYDPPVNINHSKGETVVICVNPKAPKSFYFADEETRFSLAGVSLAAGGVILTIIGIVLSIMF